MLKTLSLYKSEIESLEGLPDLQNLETLHLGYTRITSLEGIHNLPNLKDVYICGNKIALHGPIVLNNTVLHLHDSNDE